jgi:hypothetical protein
MQLLNVDHINIPLNKIKGKTVRVPKIHTMKIYGGLQVYIHAF